MKGMRLVMWAIALFATVGLAMTFFVEASYLGRATEVQPIERDPTSATGWRLVGEKLRVLDVPSNALVTRGGPGIPPQADATVLRSSGAVSLGPIQQTIQTARWGALIALGMMIVGLVAIGRLAIHVPDGDAGA